MKYRPEIIFVNDFLVKSNHAVVVSNVRQKVKGDDFTIIKIRDEKSVLSQSDTFENFQIFKAYNTIGIKKKEKKGRKTEK